MEPQILYWESPIGLLELAAEGGALCGIGFARAPRRAQAAAPVLTQAAAQLAEYFAGQRREFTLPLALHGTGFQRRVWAELCRIPYGETRTYAQLAAAAGCPKGYRAVGMANHRNPVMIVVPCHRVINTGGALGGYAGGLDAKRTLLALEGVDLSVLRV